VAFVSAEEHERVIAEHKAELAERDRLIAELKEQVEALRARLDKNSGNSHLPPSSDGPGAVARGVRPPKKRHGGKRKRGGQKGRRGARRQFLPPDRVHEFVDHFPDGCERCAAELSRNPDPHALRYQVVDLRDGALHVTEHRRHAVTCERCGHATLAAYDRTKIPSSPFGPGLVTAVTMLTGVYHLSRRETQRLLRDLFRFEISRIGSIKHLPTARSRNVRPSVGFHGLFCRQHW
jgi:hypothetical protein